MAIRITESQLRKIVREEAARLVRPRRLSEAPMRGGPRITDMEGAAAAVLAGDPASQDAACEFLARMFDGSPTPSMDIASALEDLGVDGDTAFDIGDACEMKYM